MTNPSHTELAARKLWETIKILGLQNEKLALQAIAAALESPERVQGDGDFVTWLKTRAADSYSCGLLVKDALARLATPSPQAGKQPLSDTDIQDLLLVGNPDDRDVKMIRLGEAETFRRLGIVTKEST